MQINGEFIGLAKFSQEHVHKTYEWLISSCTLLEQIDCIGMPTKDGNAQYWESKLKKSDIETYAIINNGIHIGNCGLNQIDHFRKKSEIWIYLGESYGNGFGQEALTLLIKRAFRDLNLNKLSAKILANNHKSIQLFKKMGFAKEGLSRQGTFHQGRFIDIIYMGLLFKNLESKLRLENI